jgi:hypothetical protein
VANGGSKICDVCNLMHFHAELTKVFAGMNFFNSII